VIEDRESGIRVRFVEKYDIQPDPSPVAMTVAQCPWCGERFGGIGTSLVESDRDATARFRGHACEGYLRIQAE
jgi:hypothetical protein